MSHEDWVDIFEAEFGSDHLNEWETPEVGLDGLDESQALEVISVQSGLLFGERFYKTVRVPSDEADLLDYYVLRPMLDCQDWHSIEEI